MHTERVYLVILRVFKNLIDGLLKLCSEIPFKGSG